MLDKSKILKFSQDLGGERYVKRFDAWQHLAVMLYAAIKRFDSLREITESMFPEVRKLAHIGVRMMPMSAGPLFLGRTGEGLAKDD